MNQYREKKKKCGFFCLFVWWLGFLFVLFCLFFFVWFGFVLTVVAAWECESRNELSEN